MASAYSSEVTISGYQKWRIYLTATVSNKSSSVCTVSYSASIQMINAYHYGVQVSVSGGTSKTGVLTSNPGSNWKTVCTATGTFSVSRGTSAKNYTVTASGKGASVSGYGPAPGSTSVRVTVSIPANSTTYTVAYNANGGTGAPSSQTKKYGVTLKLSSTIPEREGYRFVGWATSSTATSANYQPGGNYTANASVTLYAVWTVDSYIISYNANGGEGAPGNQTKRDGVTLTLSSTEPTRKRHNFLGWATSSTATQAQYQPGGSFTTDADTVLYALWQLTDDYIMLYSSGICEAVEFIEDDSGVMFQDGGKIHASKFIETDDGILIGNIMHFGELEEV